MGIEMSWQLAGTWERATFQSIFDTSKVFQPAEEKLSESCPVELVESQGMATEIWNIQRVFTDIPGENNVITVYIASEADPSYVLAEQNGMLVVQKKREKNPEFQIWEVVGEGGHAVKIDDSSYTVALPAAEFIYEGFDKLTNTVVNEPGGTKDNIWIWKVPKEKIGMIYKNIFYTAVVDQDYQTKVTVTVKDGTIVTVKGAELMPSMTLKDWLNLDDHWTKDAVDQVGTLTSRGIVTKIDKISLSSEFLDSEDVVTAVPAMSIATSLVILGIHLNLSQWETIEENITELECFEFGGGATIDRDSVDIFVRICAKMEKVILGDVHIEDVGLFVSSVIMYFYRGGAKCQMIQFGKETLERYKEEIFELGEKMGWNVMVNDVAQGVKIVKDDKIKERQKAYSEKAWKVMGDTDKIDSLKIQFDFMEKKMDHLTDLVTEALGFKAQMERREKDVGRMQASLRRMEDEASRARLDEFFRSREVNLPPSCMPHSHDYLF